MNHIPRQLHTFLLKDAAIPVILCESADVSEDFVGLIFGVFNYGNFGCWDVPQLSAGKLCHGYLVVTLQ